ncbi:MAG: hypothetical protein ACOC0R_06090 [Mariniphaga sp.]
MHTIFSDGSVWPTVRVDEAWAEGLDAIAITDHIENQPSKKFVGGDHNASYDIALPRAQERNIILIRGGEITRSMPPGHLNGLFLTDVNALDTPEAKDAIKAVADQGGFILWNHPGWKAQQPDTCLWMDMHQEMYEQGLIHGIEVFNEKEWYPIVLDWCRDKKLAVIGNSDIHGVNSHYYDVENNYRPMTLVFSKDRSEAGIKEAMFARRTLAWFDGKVAGDEALLKQFVMAAIDVKTKAAGELLLENMSCIPFMLQDETGNKYLLPAESKIVVTVQDGTLKVMNTHTGSKENLEIRF